MVKTAAGVGIDDVADRVLEQSGREPRWSRTSADGAVSLEYELGGPFGRCVIVTMDADGEVTVVNTGAGVEACVARFDRCAAGLVANYIVGALDLAAR